jgi:hypothetical protein
LKRLFIFIISTTQILPPVRKKSRKRNLAIKPSSFFLPQPALPPSRLVLRAHGTGNPLAPAPKSICSTPRRVDPLSTLHRRDPLSEPRHRRDPLFEPRRRRDPFSAPSPPLPSTPVTSHRIRCPLGLIRWRQSWMSWIRWS